MLSTSGQEILGESSPGFVAAENGPCLPNLHPGEHSLIRSGRDLPLPLTSFIGRESQIAEVRRLLRPSSKLAGAGGSPSRLLTLVGPCGCGKTRLAIESVRGLVEEFADGVCWIDLGALSHPDFVLQTVACSQGVQEQPGQLLFDQVASAIRSRQLLLVWDNCEHLLPACGRLAAALLQTCPHLYILATSRVALKVAGEIPRQVPSLSLPDPQHLFQSQADPILQLNQYEAIRLFVDRAAAIAPGFTLTGQNFAAIAQICQRLDGIPLAIELAAVRAKVLTAQQIAGRLDRIFHLLTRGDAALPRHRTLRAAVDWSYNLLPEKARLLLHRLSVFEGSFSLTDVEMVCSEDGLCEEEILDILSDLVDQSLVSVTEREPSEEARYRLLEMIRQYGQEMLEKSGEGERMRERHLAFSPLFAQPAPGWPAASLRTERVPDRLPTPRQADKQKYGGLTSRERQVAGLVSQGKSNQEIAAELFVGLKTAEAHITHILSKLGFASRTQIAAWSVSIGLTEAMRDPGAHDREGKEL